MDDKDMIDVAKDINKKMHAINKMTKKVIKQANGLKIDITILTSGVIILYIMHIYSHFNVGG